MSIHPSGRAMTVNLEMTEGERLNSDLKRLGATVIHYIFLLSLLQISSCLSSPCKSNQVMMKLHGGTFKQQAAESVTYMLNCKYMNKEQQLCKYRTAYANKEV